MISTLFLVLAVVAFLLATTQPAAQANSRVALVPLGLFFWSLSTLLAGRA